jgi:hypothetical protein
MNPSIEVMGALSAFRRASAVSLRPDGGRHSSLASVSDCVGRRIDTWR